MKAFIFDLDGTLVDTLHDIGTACNAMLQSYGFPQHEISQYRNFIGKGFSVLVQRALPPSQLFTPEELLEMTEKARQCYNDCYLEQSHPYPYIEQTLKQLLDKGMQLAVLSNKPDQWTKPIIKTLFNKIDFTEIRGAMPNVPLKPDPTAALEVLGRMGVKPVDCYYVGDSDVDMLTGINCGMQPIGVSWGFCKKQIIVDSGAARVLDDARQLVSLIP